MASNKGSKPVMDTCYAFLSERVNEWFTVEDLAKEFKFDRTAVVGSMNIAYKDKERYPNLKKKSERKNTFFTSKTMQTSGYHTTVIRYRVKE